MDDRDGFVEEREGLVRQLHGIPIRLANGNTAVWVKQCHLHAPSPSTCHDHKYIGGINLPFPDMGGLLIIGLHIDIYRCLNRFFFPLKDVKGLQIIWGYSTVYSGIVIKDVNMFSLDLSIPWTPL